jgi:hypothetical protein
MTTPSASELFQDSWEGAEEYYPALSHRPGYEFLHPMGAFVEELRRRGFDQKFRLGHALWSLVLSRSLAKRLSPEKPYVEIRPLPEGGLAIHYQLAGKRGVLRSEAITLSPQLVRLLGLLASEQID